MRVQPACVLVVSLLNVTSACISQPSGVILVCKEGSSDRGEDERQPDLPALVMPWNGRSPVGPVMVIWPSLDISLPEMKGIP